MNRELPQTDPDAALVIERAWMMRNRRRMLRNRWREILVEDRRVGPAETAASRIDFAEWLVSLPARLRCIAENLAIGETTGWVASRFRLSAGRISQMRRELRQGWDDYQGDALLA